MSTTPRVLELEDFRKVPERHSKACVIAMSNIHASRWMHVLCMRLLSLWAQDKLSADAIVEVHREVSKEMLAAGAGI